MDDNLQAVALGTNRYAISISAGWSHTCAILDDRSLKCWGSNSNGQLGQGDRRHRGVQTGQLGDALPAIRLGTNQTAGAVTAGVAHTCVLVEPGRSVKCFGWGGNGNGQLGYGDSSDRGVTSGQMGDGLGAIALGTNRWPTAISAGGHHTCVVLDDSSLKCFGDNGDGCARVVLARGTLLLHLFLVLVTSAVKGLWLCGSASD
jgi:hypothetical protein